MWRFLLLRPLSYALPYTWGFRSEHGVLSVWIKVLEGKRREKARVRVSPDPVKYLIEIKDLFLFQIYSKYQSNWSRFAALSFFFIDPPKGLVEYGFSIITLTAVKPSLRLAPSGLNFYFLVATENENLNRKIRLLSLLFARA